MTAKDFAKMKHVEFKKHLAIARSGVDGSTPLACRRGLLPKTMGSGRSQTKVDRSKCKTGAEMRRGRPARPPSDTFEWCGVKFKVKRPPVEAVPEAAPRDPRPGTAARAAAADITAAVVDDLGGAAPAPAPLTPWEESLVGDAFKAPEGSRFKDRDLLAGVDVYAHMRDHAARGRPVSTNWVRWHPGLIPALYHAARLAGPRGAVVVPTPVYPPFLNAAKDASQCIELDLGNEGGPLDEALLRETLDKAVATADGEDVVLLWCNPHNPTGRVWRRHEMEAVARECSKRNIILASDEVWSGLILDDVPFTPAGALDVDVRLISITSASKTYNVAGLDVAFAVVEDDALRRRYFLSLIHI